MCGRAVSATLSSCIKVMTSTNYVHFLLSISPVSSGCGRYGQHYAIICLFDPDISRIIERQGLRHGFSTTIPSYDDCLEVSLILFVLSAVTMLSHRSCWIRDPSQHSALASEIDAQSTAYYSTARLWDDGIIRPIDTRDTLGLALSLSHRGSGAKHGSSLAESTTWDGQGRGFGVFRM